MRDSRRRNSVDKWDTRATHVPAGLQGIPPLFACLLGGTKLLCSSSAAHWEIELKSKKLMHAPFPSNLGVDCTAAWTDSCLHRSTFTCLGGKLCQVQKHSSLNLSRAARRDPLQSALPDLAQWILQFLDRSSIDHNINETKSCLFNSKTSSILINMGQYYCAHFRDVNI